MEQELAHLTQKIKSIFEQYAPSKEAAAVRAYTQQAQDVMDNLSKNGNNPALNSGATSLVNQMNQLAQEMQLSKEAIGLLSNEQVRSLELKDHLESRANHLQGQLNQLSNTKEQLENKIKEKAQQGNEAGKVSIEDIKEAAKKALEEIIEEDKREAVKEKLQEVPKEARCNIGVHKAVEKLTGSDELIDKSSEERNPILANAMVDHFPSSLNWEEIKMSQAQDLANQGYIVVAGAKAGPGETSGHVVMIVPGREENSKTWGGKVPMTMDTGEDHRWSSKKLSEGFGEEKQARTKFYRYKGPIKNK